MLKVVILFLLAMTGMARAEWKMSKSYVAASSTQLRVLSSTRLELTVNGKTDTAPAVFVVPNQDGYIQVEVRSPGRTAFRTKVEVRRGQETKLEINWVESKEVAPKPQAVRRIGSLANTTQHCGKGLEIRFDIKDGNREVLSRVVAPAAVARNLEVPDGTYTVRVFEKSGAEFVFKTSGTLKVTADGWSHGHGCSPKAPPKDYEGLVKVCRNVTNTLIQVQIGPQFFKMRQSTKVVMREGTWHYSLAEVTPHGAAFIFKRGQVTIGPSWSLDVLCE